MLRIAASTYLNSAPLVYSFSSGAQRARALFLGDAAPSRCAQMLARGQADVALIPVIEYQRIPRLRLIRDVAVACKTRVRSVLLVARRPLADVRSVTLDAASRTSQTLVKILFARRYGREPSYEERTPDVGADCANMLESSDAALVIGDPALRLAANAAGAGLAVYDLAAEWRELTGLPFVFAVWAVREEALGELRRAGLDFTAAKREGLERVEEIAAEYAREIALPRADLLSYLRESVNFDLDRENLAGLRKYFRTARECGLTEADRVLRFVDE
jgi:chorismate dehydratase